MRNHNRGNITSRHIEKGSIGEASSDYRKLWQSGLAAVQELAGGRWTDYNTHDPGVTILEQLCYALTESIYKSDFPVGDYLTGPDGAIDYDRQALFRPEQILPCRPVTLDDYREAIFDAVPEIDDIFLDPLSDDGPKGRYAIRIRLAPHVQECQNTTDADRIIETVKTVYGTLRNLCEDAEVVQVICPALCRLKGRIEIDGHRDPADLLAQIYFDCARLIAPGIAVVPYDVAMQEGRSLERLFTGPLIRCGHIGRRELQARHRPVTLAEIVSVIRSVEGVSGIQDLVLLDAQDASLEALPPLQSAAATVLAIPARDREMGITLLKKTRAYPVSAQTFKTKYDRLAYNHRARKHIRQDYSTLYDPPPAVHRPLRRYASIQHHFPRAYGIGREGVPRSAGPRRLAQARQLKGYLLLFDQIMADFNAQLDHLGSLFSTDESLKRSYFHQVLDDDNVAHISDLQTIDGEPLDQRLSRNLQHYDDYHDRRSRVLDYLLAIYGEQFTQKYLRHFHHYAPPTRSPQTVIDNKIRLLKHLPAIGHNRGAAQDYRYMAWEERRTSGFELKVRILLGMPHLHAHSLTSPLASFGLKLISDDQFREVISGGLEIPHLKSDDIRVVPTDQFHAVPPDPFSGSAISTAIVEKLQQHIMLLQRQFVSSSFFKRGIDPRHYLIGPLTTAGDIQVIFRPFAQDQWCHLAAFSNRNDAVQAVNHFCRLLLYLNMESEGLHVLEHLLLRPLTRAEHPGLDLPDDFYSFKISVLMPAWTARCQDEAFRRHAEDTVRINCPAHVSVCVYWLDYKRMHAFEMIYRQWLTAKSETPDGSPDLDTLSAQIARQLLTFQITDTTDTTLGD